MTGTLRLVPGLALALAASACAPKSAPTFGRGGAAPTAAQLALMVDEVDPDLLTSLDPQHPPPGAVAGEVRIQPSANVMPGGALSPLNQGMQSSCSAFSVGAAATLLRAQREGGDANRLWASPAFLYERLRSARTPTIPCNEGTYISDGLNALVREGSATLDEVPYTAVEDGAQCAMGSGAAMGHVYRIGGWEAMRPVSRSKIKEALSAGLVVPFGVELPDGFMQWGGEAAAGVYKPGPGNCVGQHCGGHAMLIVGYDDQKGAYRILNSWGAGWGDGGYLWWDYDDFEKRPGLHAYTLTAAPEPRPFAAPNPGAFAVQVVGTALWRDEQNGWMLTARLDLSEPLNVTSTVYDGRATLLQDVWVSYGDVNFLAGEEQPQPGMVSVRVIGKLRDGTEVTRDLTLTRPAPKGGQD